ncbi:hypothetical protein EIP86_010734 [Pleurotus ostreatoroseus]|nr:hypothetical protein EIP86_010734 [Pleurotus ostreatoroseus]
MSGLNAILTPLFKVDETDEDHWHTDVILRTTDGLKFYVHTLLLSQGSPFFRSMFRLPQPQTSTDNNPDEPPVIDVQEPSETWNLILQLLYPVADPLFRTLEQVKPVLEAAQKYQFDSIIANMQHVLTTPRFVEVYPLRVYALSCCYQLNDAARAAASYALRLPLLGACVEELDLIPASVYHRLLQYHMRCADVAAAVAEFRVHDGVFVKEMAWLERRDYVFFGGRHPCTCAASRTTQVNRGPGYPLAPRVYWKELMDRTAAALRDRPCSQTVQDASIIEPAITIATRCESCRPRAYRDLKEFIDIMAREVDKEVSKVEFTLK